MTEADQTTAPITNQATPQSNDLRGVLLPLHDTHLILPNVTVAEVIGYREPDPLVNAPEWLLGTVTWRQRRLPLVSFEVFVHREAIEPGYRARIALCHNLHDDPQLPFIGILCNSIPRLARVNNDTVTEPMINEMLPEMTLKHLSYSGQDAWIPDLDALGKAAAGYL